MPLLLLSAFLAQMRVRKQKMMYDSYRPALIYLFYYVSSRAAAKPSHDDLIVIRFSMCWLLDESSRLTLVSCHLALRAVTPFVGFRLPGDHGGVRTSVQSAYCVTL